MENNDQPIRTEDILTDDSLTENLQNERLPEEDLSLARDICQVVKAGRIILSQHQKNLLDERIIQRIQNFKRRKRIAWIGSAAVVLALVGLTVMFQMQNQSDIRSFALNNPTDSDLKYTQLLLSGRHEIQIDTQESRIEYSANGSEIKIDVQRNVEQPLFVEDNIYNTVIVPYGKRSQITLSDNSTVWLNSGSKLVYPAIFDSEKREVYLEGEAMFDVSPDASHPFFVLTRNLDVKVLGTVFNLCAYSDDNTVSTVLESGSVELRYPGITLTGIRKKMMVPGMLAVYDPSVKSIIQTNVNTKNYTSWKDGYVVIEKYTLGSIVKKLSRYYNVTIEIDSPELAAETFSGYLDLRNSAIQVLELISEIVDIEIVQVDQQIKITKKQDLAKKI